VQRRVAAVAAVCLLGGPAALAFFSGGYYTQPRLIAAIVAWALVLALAATGPAPLPRTRAGVIAVAGLALLAVWSAVSITWAPLGGPAVQSVQRLVLYLGALLVALGVLRYPRVLRALEPGLAAGAAVVITYGLAGRWLPGIIDLDRSRSAGGRLEQPITYWNGEGALAAIGLVLCARLVGDRTRHPAIRTAAAAATVPLGAGVYLSYSRGAIAAAVLGLVILVAAAPTRDQLRAAVLTLAAAVAVALASAAFPGVASLEGSLDDRTGDGAIALAITVVLALAAALVARREDPRGQETLPWSRRLAPVAAVIVVVGALALVIGGLGERASEAELAAGASAGRLTTVNSNRYEYWRVAIDAFADHPVAGLGAGGFRTEWLKQRKIAEAIKDTHSIELEFAAELGLVGLLAFGLLLGGVGASARDALQRRRELAAGSAAAVLVWLLHASIDWDWQLPAVTLPAVALAGALIVLAEDEP
jgi:hypothetical protein